VPYAGQLGMTRTVLFVYPLGAGTSRTAAAWSRRRQWCDRASRPLQPRVSDAAAHRRTCPRFTIAPAGWRATSAGIGPQAALGTNAPRLPAGTPAEGQLDRQPPRSVNSVPTPERVVAICCDVPGAQRWDLAQRECTEGMAKEIRSGVNGFVAHSTIEPEGARP
jgi:hypothetical protein